MKYAWIREHRDSFPVTVMCQTLQVSASGNYARLDRAPSPRALRHERIQAAVQQVHAASHAATGGLSARQTISTLPPGFAGSNFCSEILVSSDGRFVYAVNRLHNSVGIFSVGPDGTLKHVGDEWTRGNYPRSFSFDPCGQFFYCCNQRGDNIAVFQVNRKTGSLTFTGHYAPVGNPSSIVFLDLAKER